MGGLVWADTGNLSVLPSSTPQAGWFLPRHSVPLHPNTVLVLTPFSTISTYNHQYYSYTSHFTSHLKMLWRDCLWDPKYRLVAGWRHVVCVAVERVRDDGGVLGYRQSFTPARSSRRRCLAPLCSHFLLTR